MGLFFNQSDSTFFAGISFSHETPTSKTQVSIGIGKAARRQEARKELVYMPPRQEKYLIAAPALPVRSGIPRQLALSQGIKTAGCAYCRGSGIVRGIQCPICKGKKRVHLFSSAFGCPTCSGSGRQNGIRCEMCYGSGHVELK